MKKKVLMAFISIFTVASIISFSVFAYFKLVTSVDEDLTIAPTNNIIEISTFEEFNANAKAVAYNDGSSVSSSSERITLKLKNDITLDNNLEITRDIHMDINGQRLYLNGYDLAIHHTYFGTFEIYDSAVEKGFIQATQVLEEESEATPKVGHLIIHTPNAFVLVKAVALDFTVTYNEVSNTYLAYNALYYVTDAIVDEAVIRPAKIYSKDITTTDGIFDCSVFLNPNKAGLESTCPYHTTSACCSFVFQDLDLPVQYLGFTNIRIDYESSNQNVISTMGKVTIPTEKTDVTLTAKVVNTTDNTVISQVSFPLHVINIRNATQVVDYARTMFYARLQEHYIEESNVYEMNRSIMLLKSFHGVSFSYKAYKEDAAGSYEHNSKKYALLASSDSEGLFTTNGEYFQFEPTEEVKLIVVEVSSGIVEEKITIDVTSNNLIVSTNASIARDIINNWYGNEVVIQKTSDGNYNPHDLYYLPENNAYGITSITYNIINDGHMLYLIYDNASKLGVNTDKHPEEYVQEVILNCQFSFNDGTQEQIQIGIICKTADSENVNYFLPYYTYYNELFSAITANYVSTSFEMPFAYGASGPILCYDFGVLVEDAWHINPTNTEGLKVSLYYNGQKRTELTTTPGVSYTTALDSYITSLIDSNLTSKSMVYEAILKYGDAKWQFSLDIEKVENRNTNIGLIYNYMSSVNGSAYATYVDSEAKQITTNFILAGILHSGTDVINDIFYTWIYNAFNLSGDTYSSGKYVLIDWLTQPIAVDVTKSTSLAGVTNFTGIDFLVGTKLVNLTGANITDEIILQIARLSGLETLILDSCSITDTTSVAGDKGNLDVLANLNNLRTLSLNGNKIYLFSFLENIINLQTVYIKANSISTMMDIFYGSVGLMSFPIYQSLTDSGVVVEYNDSPIASDSVNDYTKLKYGIVYQSKLQTGMDISTLYRSFSTSPSDYQLASSYNGYSVSGQSLVFGYIADATTSTCFTLTYSFRVNSTNISLVIKYDVERYS